ncbi:MAG: hypothetical protein V3T24_05285 [Longimicrobiales bacterium]
MAEETPKDKPAEELADMLGEDVVEAIGKFVDPRGPIVSGD